VTGLHQIVLSLHDRVLQLRYPSVLSNDIEVLFGAAKANAVTAEQVITICEEEGRFALSSDDQSQTNLSREHLLVALQDRVVHALIVDMKDAVALHAGAVTWNNRSTLVAGTTGVGKTALTAWLAGNGFQYISDEIVVLLDAGSKLVGFPRAMVVKEDALTAVKDLPAFVAMSAVETATDLMVRPAPSQLAARSPLLCGLIIFPHFETGAALRITPLSAAQTGLRLMGCNLNARNLPGEGFAEIVALARKTPAFALHYGDFDQLPGVLDVLIRILIDSELDSAATRRFLSAFSNTGAVPQVGGMTDKRRDIPAPTPRKPPRKLTIGMATYDDYDGVYFTLQSLRLYHPEVLDDVMFVVVDNHPDGRCAEPLKELEHQIGNYRYVPAAERLGTAVRETVFEEADSEFVLCIDCHILIFAGAIKRLLSYFESGPCTRDLLQGPMVYDDLKKLASHFHPAWRGGMYGRWEHDERANDPDGPPFEIPMQGLGLFACRRSVWPGFSSQFHGFGGEEGYIHEKFRRHGGRTLCLPFLRWVHRFNRPMGYPYPNRWDDRIRNYLVGFRELGWPTDGIVEHFREHLGRENADRIFESIEADLAET